MTLLQPTTRRQRTSDVVLADCTVVIPTYNERENIAELIQRILEGSRFRVLVVDDNSPDGTAAVVAELAADEPRVGLLLRPEKRGLGSAYVAGFRRALDEGAAFICEMDADFSHDPSYLHSCWQLPKRVTTWRSVHATFQAVARPTGGSFGN